MWTSHRWGTIVGLLLVLLIGLATVIVSFIDEPLRGYLERTANERMPGYELRIGALNIHPFRGAFEFRDVSLRQQKHPDSPVAWMESWTAGVLWRALLRGRVVSDHRIVHPSLTVTRAQAREEAAQVLDEAKEAKAWQEGVYALFPMTINEVVIENAEVTYRDQPDKDPIRLTAVDVKISNIQNVRTENHSYPSEFSIQGRMFEKGRFEIDGHADFLAQPHLGLECVVKFDDVPVDKLRPVTGRYNVQLRKGIITAKGRVEYAPWAKEIRVEELLMDKIHVDYVHSAATENKEKAVAGRVAQKAKEVHQDSELKVKVDHAKILSSELGFVNKAASPDYRVFLSDVNVELEDFSNRLEEGTAVVKFTGRLMGTGRTLVTGNFRAEKPTPDFDLEVRIVKTTLPSLNDLFRAYTEVDLKAGTFAFFSEVRAKDGRFDGYVKPFFKDVEVYDPDQDRDKALTQQVYEAVIGGLSGLLKNTRSEEVATETDVSGPVDNPQADTWQLVVNLIQNAFFNAILPGFEREYGKA